MIDNTKKKILIITNHYMDDNNGGANCSKAYIRAFSEIYPNCTLLYPGRKISKGTCFIPHGIKAIPLYDSRSKIRKGLDIFRGVLTRMPRQVKAHLKKNNYDIIVIDHSVVGGGIADFLKLIQSNIVTIHHNDEVQYLKDNKPNILYRIPKFYFASKAENDMLSISSLNISLSEHDAQTFRKRFSSKNIIVQNVGTFLFENLNDVLDNANSIKGRTFAITGSLYFPQSVTPIVEFIKRFYPLLLQIIPEAKLIVAGRNPTNVVKEMCSLYPSINLIENPENMQDVIKKADYYICPINMGSGVKLRVMDGLRQGLPVIAHDVSTNGYEHILKDGYMFSYHDEVTFKHAIEQLLNADISPNDVYKSFYSYYSYKAGKERLSTLLKQNNLL